MRFLKRVVITLLVLVALVLIVALFIDRTIHVERSIVVNKPKNDVFQYIREVKNQDYFSVWNQKDPNMKKTYKGTDGTVGFVYAWDSQNKDVGAGEQEITSITEGQRLNCALRFKRPFENEASTSISTADAGNNATKVTWGFDGSMPYPFNIMRLFTNMDDMLGKDLQGGLDNLKRTLETEN